MWPWAHLAVGYLGYSLVSRLRNHHRPGGIGVIGTAVGTQLPDLVDKPFAYVWHVLPQGRSLAHSLLVIVPICLAVIALARAIDTEEAGIGFAVGSLSHPFADGVGAIVTGDWAAVSYLVYPLLPPPEYETASFAGHWATLSAALGRLDLQTLLSPWADSFVLQLWLAAGVAILWLSDGCPPVDILLDRIAARDDVDR